MDRIGITPLEPSRCNQDGSDAALRSPLDIGFRSVSDHKDLAWFSSKSIQPLLIHSLTRFPDKQGFHTASYLERCDQGATPGQHSGSAVVCAIQVYIRIGSNQLVSFKSVYMGISYDFFIAQIQLLLMFTAQQKSFLCENGPPRSSSEHRGLFCGKSATYSFLMAIST